MRKNEPCNCINFSNYDNYYINYDSQQLIKQMCANFDAKFLFLLRRTKCVFSRLKNDNGKFQKLYLYWCQICMFNCKITKSVWEMNVLPVLKVVVCWLLFGMSTIIFYKRLRYAFAYSKIFNYIYSEISGDFKKYTKNTWPSVTVRRRRKFY